MDHEAEGYTLLLGDRELRRSDMFRLDVVDEMTIRRKRRESSTTDRTKYPVCVRVPLAIVTYVLQPFGVYHYQSGNYRLAFMYATSMGLCFLGPAIDVLLSPLIDYTRIRNLWRRIQSFAYVVILGNAFQFHVSDRPAELGLWISVLLWISGDHGRPRLTGFANLDDVLGIFTVAFVATLLGDDTVKIAALVFATIYHSVSLPHVFVVMRPSKLLDFFWFLFLLIVDLIVVNRFLYDFVIRLNAQILTFFFCEITGLRVNDENVDRNTVKTCVIASATIFSIRYALVTN